MRRPLIFVTPVALIFSILTITALADAVKLDSGKTIEGRVVMETSVSVQIAVGGATLTIPRGKIASISKADAAPSSGPATLEQLQTLETKGLWPELHEAATRLLGHETSNTVAVEKQKLASDRIRETFGWKKISELVRDRKFDEAIATLTERLRQSEFAAPGVAAVGRRALAELYVANARYQMRSSPDAHILLNGARKARELDPSTPGLDYVEGIAQMNLHNFDPAAALLERAAHAEPKDFGICIQLMNCYREKGDFGRIVGLCEAAAAETSASARNWPEVRALVADAYAQVAVQLANQGKKTEAAAVYEKHLRFSDRTADDLRAAAAFFERLGDFERARTVRNERPQPRTETRPTISPLITPKFRR